VATAAAGPTSRKSRSTLALLRHWSHFRRRERRTFSFGLLWLQTLGRLYLSRNSTYEGLLQKRHTHFRSHFPSPLWWRAGATVLIFLWFNTYGSLGFVRAFAPQQQHFLTPQKSFCRSVPSILGRDGARPYATVPTTARGRYKVAHIPHALRTWHLLEGLAIPALNAQRALPTSLGEPGPSSLQHCI